MTEIGFKPCPFCGGNVKLWNLADSEIYVVGCNKDTLCPCYVGKMAPAYYTRQLAAEKWNRREKDGSATEHV